MELAVITKGSTGAITVVKNYGAVSVAEFEAFVANATENAAAYSSLLAKTAAQTPKTLQMDTLRPFFDAYMVEYENRTTAYERLAEKIKNANEKAIRNVKLGIFKRFIDWFKKLL
jgi:uncharacterized iron-regulated protein